MGNVTQLKADFVGKDINALPLENQVRKALHFNASFSFPVMQVKEGVNIQAFYKRRIKCKHFYGAQMALNLAKSPYTKIHTNMRLYETPIPRHLKTAL